MVERVSAPYEIAGHLVVDGGHWDIPDNQGYVYDPVANSWAVFPNFVHATRNYAMILIAYRHGLRASEVTGLRVSDIDLKRGTIYCRRAKNSRSSLHPLKPDEVAALEKVLRQRKLRTSEHLFQSERAAKLSRSAFWRVVAQTGERAGMPMNVYAHQLRHYACGYCLAKQRLRFTPHPGLPGPQQTRTRCGTRPLMRGDSWDFGSAF